MTSSIGPVSGGTPEKTDDKVVNPFQRKSTDIRSSHNNNSKLTMCGHIAKKCFGEKFRPSVGLCMIAFAVPLIVPGITLTVVAFDGGTGFTKYSALHILGMVLLGFAVLLTTGGIVLNIKFQTRIVRNESQLTDSLHGKAIKDDNSDTAVTLSSYVCLQKKHAFTTVLVPGLPSFSHVVHLNDNSVEDNPKNDLITVDAGSSSNTGPKHVSFSARKGSKRQFSSNKSFEDYSSSFDSFDSDDVSFGSYIISEDPGGERPVQELESAMATVHEIDELRSFSTFKARNLNKLAFSFESFGYSKGTNLKLVLPSLDDLVSDFNEEPNGKSHHNDGHGPHKATFTFDQCDGFPVQASQTTNESSRFISELQVEANSPGSRQRLHGLSSDVFATSSSDLLVSSCDSLKKQDVASDEHMSVSNPSVFSLERLTNSAIDTAHDSCARETMLAHLSSSNQDITSAQSPTKRPHSFPFGDEIFSGDILNNNSVFCLELLANLKTETTRDHCSKEITRVQPPDSTQRKTWAQSPSTKRPHSFPIGGETSSSGAIVRNNSLNEKHITSLGEFSR